MDLRRYLYNGKNCAYEMTLGMANCDFYETEPFVSNVYSVVQNFLN